MATAAITPTAQQFTKAQIDGEKLATYLPHALKFATSEKDSFRENLKGIHFHCIKGTLYAEATDGFSLIRAAVGICEGEFTALVRGLDLANLAKDPATVKTLTELHTDGIKATFIAPAMQVSVPIMDERYPSLHEVIPTKFLAKAELPCPWALGAILKLGKKDAFAPDKVKIDVDGTVSVCQKTDYEAAYHWHNLGTMGMSLQGNLPNPIGLCAKMLAKCLAVFTDKPEVCLNDHNQAVIFKHLTQDVLVLVMPFILPKQ